RRRRRDHNQSLMDAPRPTGNRLAIVHGHSLPPGMTIETEGVVALPRHGLDHGVPAHLLDHHANIRAVCELGCDRVIALASVGGLRADLPAGTLVCPGDFFAPGVAPSFYEDSRGHSVPGFDQSWRRRLLDAWGASAQMPLRDGGVYAQVPGPRFETPAEVRMLARHADVVGMTIAAESILAKEAGIAYAAICTVDNLANGLEAGPLSVDGYRAFRAGFAPRLLEDLGRVLPGLAAGVR
ncbi:MAG: MTAP family purine nucleoside phosphorylase, partial [Solirubrobacterales bacterium]